MRLPKLGALGTETLPSWDNNAAELGGKVELLALGLEVVGLVAIWAWDFLTATPL